MPSGGTNRRQLLAAYTALADIPDHGHKPRTLFRNLVERPPVVRHKSGLQKQIFRRIAGHRQFRKHHQVGAGLPRFFDPRFDKPHISGNITDRRVNLRHGNPQYAHQTDLPSLFDRLLAWKSLAGSGLMQRFMPLVKRRFIDRHHPNLSDPFRPHTDNFPSGHFLVMKHRFPDFGRCPLRQAIRQTGRLDNGLNVLNNTTIADPQKTGDVSLLNQPDPDSLTMNERFVSTQRLKRMSDRMAIVEDSPPVRLPLVRCNHVSFDFARPLHYCDDNFWLSLKQTGHLPLKIRKKPLIGDNAILDDLRQTGNPLTHRQSPKRQRINPYFLGLVERPDQILTKPMIDSCLSPD